LISLIVDAYRDNVQNSRDLKRISNVVWVTLSKIRNGDGKLAWDGVESEDLTFFLHHQKALQKMMQV
jgi:hypothetical protein